MFNKFLFLSAAVLMTVALLVAPASAETITLPGTSVTMEFVTVGDTDNAGDPTRGAVDYSYRIGKYEVTENQWDAVAAAVGWPLSNETGQWTGEQPVGSISWTDMAHFCNWLTSGNFTKGAYTVSIGGIYPVTGIERAAAIATYGTVYVIPTENEWYKAAYYDGSAEVYYDFPTGSDTQPDGIDSDGDPLFEVVCNDGYNQGQPNVVTNAGSLSPYGTMGQGGNVYELTETEHSAGNCVMRGSNYGSGPDRTGYNWRFGHGYTAEGASIGFRVAIVPEPGSIALLLCGLASLICWRRWR